ncbi:TetR/AcrR family transcriptional regulator [Nocardia panacis]|nr:TetR/AcrR family transcriptional regulator [Nocardia panacis]
MSDTVRRRGRPAKLSLEAIVAAAEEIVGSEGVGALTMRRVADRVGSSPMAIYRHVRDKDELLLTLLDRVAARVERPELPADPRERLTALWRLIYDTLTEHPWVVAVLAGGDLAGASILWAVEEILRALLDCGLSRQQAAAAYRAVWQYTVGVLTIRIAMAGSAMDRPSGQLRILASVDLPLIAAFAADWPHPWDNYDYGLGRLLDGLITNP